jgi:hypothetical protein
MPKIESAHDREVEALLQQRAEFEAGFRRSRKGNLWRNFEGLTATIFRRQGDDFFGWSIAGNEGVRFSNSGYESEEDALGALWSELGAGE